MTDYLELASQEEADALLEEQRRLERTGLSLYRAQESGEEMVAGGRTAGDPERELPLLAHVIRAEEQAARAAALTRTEMQEMASSPAGVYNAFGITEIPEAALVRERLYRETEPLDAAGIAEQLDLTFRRDSRRYDGGFYLY